MTKPADASVPDTFLVHSRPALVAVGAVCLLTVGVVVWLILQGRMPDDAVVESRSTFAYAEDTGINVMQVMDARERTGGTVTVGGRYRVSITDASRDGVAGLARINGLIVFVPDVVEGDDVIIEITRLRRSAADAVVIAWMHRAPFAVAVPPTDTPHVALPLEDQSGDGEVAVGQEFVVTVVERDRRNPSRDGVARINGLVIFVPGTQPGDRVRIRITERLPRAARAVVLEHVVAHNGGDA